MTNEHLCVIFIQVREGISKALRLTDATSTNGEETLERERRLQVALQFMKTRNIINADNEDSKHPFAVYQHIILRNGWEYYLEKENKDGIAFGYVMGFHNEWGCVYLPELEDHVVSRVKGVVLDEIMPPEGYYWEDEKKVLENEEKSLTGV